MISMMQYYRPTTMINLVENPGRNLVCVINAVIKLTRFDLPYKNTLSYSVIIIII